MKGKKNTVKKLNPADLQPVRNFDELAAQLPYTTIARKTKTDKRRMKRLLSGGVGDMTLGELYKIAEVIGMPLEQLRDLAIAKIEGPGKTKRR